MLKKLAKRSIKTIIYVLSLFLAIRGCCTIKHILFSTKINDLNIINYGCITFLFLPISILMEELIIYDSNNLMDEKKIRFEISELFLSFWTMVEILMMFGLSSIVYTIIYIN